MLARLWRSFVVRFDAKSSRTAARATLHAWLATQPGMRVESERRLVWEDEAAWLFADLDLVGDVSSIRVSVLEKLDAAPVAALATRIADHLMWRVWDETKRAWLDAGWFRRARALEDAGQHEKAVKAYDASIETKEPNWLPSLFNKGHVVLHRLDRAADALAVFEEYRRHAPKDWMGVFQVGNALSRLGRLEEALAMHREAVALDTDAADAWHNIAEVNLQLRRPVEALAVLDEHVARLAPDDTGLHYNRACAYALLGKKDEAFVHLAKAMAADPERYREKSPKDRDLVSLLDDPRFVEMMRR